MTISRTFRMALALALLGVAACAAAQAETPAAITVEHAWARATSASQRVGGVFLTIVDHGGPDRLLSATTPAAESLQLHESTDDGGVMKMRMVPVLPLVHGQSVQFKPGGYHLMAMGLKRQLTPGARFPVTLNFEKAGAVSAMVTVGSAGAAGPRDDAIGDAAMGGGSMAGMAMPMTAPAKQP